MTVGYLHVIFIRKHEHRDVLFFNIQAPRFAISEWLFPQSSVTNSDLVTGVAMLYINLDWLRIRELNRETSTWSDHILRTCSSLNSHMVINSIVHARWLPIRSGTSVPDISLDVRHHRQVCLSGVEKVTLNFTTLILFFNDPQDWRVLKS